MDYYKIAFLYAPFILAALRMRKGFRIGMMKEVVNILSAVVACVSVALIFLAVSSVKAQTFSLFTVCVAGLIGIGIVFKLCKLIFAPIAAIANISLINWLDKALGAVLGLAEAAIFIWFAYKALLYFGIELPI